MISVIVPVYNVERYLQRCVDSILNQTFRDIELILIDDGSTDRCGEICDRYSVQDDRIRVIHQINAGLSAARNAGIDVASGEFLSFVDSDDFIHCETLETLHRSIIDNDADIAVCSFLRVSENGEFIDPFPVSDDLLSTPEGIITTQLAIEGLFGNLHSYWGVVWNKLYKNDLFKNIRFPVGKTFEDVYVMHEILYQCSRIFTVDKKLYYYQNNSASITNSIGLENRVDLYEGYIYRMRFFEDHEMTVLLKKQLNIVYYLYCKCVKNREIKDEALKKRVKLLKRNISFFLCRYDNLKFTEKLSFEFPKLFSFLHIFRSVLSRKR